MSDPVAIAMGVAAPAHTVDGLQPESIVSPASLEDLQEVLRAAYTEPHAVIPLGSGARVGFGNIPTAYHTAISTTSLNRIVAYEPADMTMTVQAGASVAQIQQTLAEHGQFLPLDTVGAPGTIGGLLGANAFGALRHRYGTARDWLIGLRVVHADGATSKSGGRVVKNVSGYDLHKAHVGAVGTLGIIAEATFKLAPLPKMDVTIAISCPSASAAASITRECHERGLSLIAAELLSPTAAHGLGQQPRWTALVRIAGGAAAVARSTRDIRDLAILGDASIAELGDLVWSQWRVAFGEAPLRLRASVSPARVAETAEAVDRRFAGDRVSVSATITAGLLRINLSPRDDVRSGTLLDQVREIVLGRNGQVVVEEAPLDLKREIDVFGPLRSDFAIMKQLKSEFDPSGILSPGRFVGRL